MKDRVSLYPGRVKLTPVSGQENTYDMVRADEPTQEGTPLNKATLLKDSTAALFGLSADAVPDDTFKNIAKRFELLKTGKAWVSVKVQDTSGSPVTQVIVAGITDGDGGSVYTNENGVAEGYSENGTITLSISGYADVEDISKSITVGSGEIVHTEIIATRRNFLKLTSSTNVIFSGEAKAVDITVVGGGGGGSSGSGSYYDTFSCGGGGGYCTVRTGISVNAKTSYHAVVGAGGAAGTSDNSNGTAGTGGTSSFMEVTANGGIGGALNIYAGAGTGNGNGGVGGTLGNPPRNGGDGAVLGYSSYTETVRYGGGGAGGIGSWNAETQDLMGHGGKDFGGNGGYGYRNGDYLATVGGNGVDGGGGGGGGGAYNGPTGGITRGGKGGSGCVAMRIHFKEVV